MPENNNTLKDQRDRFLAFAFAAADLLVEVSEERNVTFVLGAVKGLTGVSEKKIIGRSWLELFSAYEQTTIQDAMENCKPGKRCGPMIMRLSDLIGGKKTIVTGIRMPNDPRYYLTISFSNKILEDVAEKKAPAPKNITFSDRRNFVRDTRNFVKLSIENKSPAFITFINLSPLYRLEKPLGTNVVKVLTTSVYEVLLDTYAGQAAGEISDKHVALLHTQEVDPQTVTEGIKSVLTGRIPDGTALDFDIRTLTPELTTLDKREISCAITHAADVFEKEDGFTFESLADALDDYKTTREYKQKTFNSFIDRVSFSFVFQPVIDLRSMEADHFEFFCRFEDGGHTQEWINFAEDENLISKFDLSVCERVINHVNFKEGGSWKRFSMNISHYSLEDAAFRDKFLEQVKKNKATAKRLMFEITNAAKIKDIDAVNTFLAALKPLGFKVILDDMTPDCDAASLANVDYWKLDTAYSADSTPLASLAKTVKGRGIDLIIKGVETDEQLESIKNSTAELAQGYVFGGPQNKPVYPPPQD